MHAEASLETPTATPPAVRADSADLSALRQDVTDRFGHPSRPRALFQLIVTGGLLVGTWMLSLWGLENMPWLSVALTLPLALLLVRSFIFQHDCGHGSFFASQKANDTLGCVLGVLTLTPYHYWLRTHAIHHATSGNLSKRGTGDIWTLTLKEYAALSKKQRFGYHLYRSPIVLFGVGALFHFFVFHRWPTNMESHWKKERRGVILTDIALVAGIAGLCALVGWQQFLLIQVPATALSCGLGVWLFYVQHQYEDTYWVEAKDWEFERAGLDGSSYFRLPKVIQWFTGNIGLHHVHHLSSRVPNYRLEACMRAYPALQEPRTITFRSSFKCAGLKIWDEAERKLISFRDARERLRASS